MPKIVKVTLHIYSLVLSVCQEGEIPGLYYITFIPNYATAISCICISFLQPSLMNLLYSADVCISKADLLCNSEMLLGWFRTNTTRI
jgi:hypothetical protein